MSERSTRRDDAVDPAKGRDIPHGTDEHADNDGTPDTRERPAKSEPSSPDEIRDRPERKR